MKNRKPTGFTLVELMIVVIILGVLAAIAVPVFLGPYHYSKTAEVQALLRDIAAKEEAYKSEFGQYLNVSGTMSFAARKPSGAPRGDFGYLDWPNTPSDDIDRGFQQLGFKPQGGVRFGYVVVAGLPGGDVSGVPPGLMDRTDGSDGKQDHWWAAVAYGNVDVGTVSSETDCSQYYLSSTRNVMTIAYDGR
jgi:prepilin-type N-terminal cleavage/methylation domain-containing protein